LSTIPFTQYVRPDGERKPVTIDRPEHIALAADKIRRHGFRFEIEELLDGEISMTISDSERDYHIRVCANGPAVPLTVDELVKTFNLGAAIKLRDSLKGA
jgi:hypothetical protein